LIDEQVVQHFSGSGLDAVCRAEAARARPTVAAGSFGADPGKNPTAGTIPD